MFAAQLIQIDGTSGIDYASCSATELLAQALRC
jgi:hypothetical protein